LTSEENLTLITESPWMTFEHVRLAQTPHW
jgi:hypothetical protein